MFYKVLVPNITYIGTNGQPKRAMKDMIIYMDNRLEVKKLKKEKAIIQVDDSKVEVGADFTLRETDPLAVPLNEISIPEDDGGNNTEFDGSFDGEITAENTSDGAGEEVRLVAAVIEGERKEGVVLAVRQDGKLQVEFTDDDKNVRLLEPEDVEEL